MRWISLVAMLLCLGQTEVDEVQLYDYGEQVVVRGMVAEGRYGPGGWDAVRCAGFVEGELVCAYDVTIVIHCSDVIRTPDLDGDGDVDLADFAEFQNAMGE